MPISPGIGPFASTIDDGAAAQRQIASDRSGEAGEVGDIAAVNQLRAGYEALDQARAKNERISALGASRTTG